MNVYHISRTDDWGYDEFSDAVVICETEQEAREFQMPSFGCWASTELINVELIGIAKEGSKKSLVCASFHAG